MVKLGDREDRIPNDPEERLRFYNANKKEMIADLRVLSNVEFKAKWPVRGQTISHLKADPLWTHKQEEVVTPKTTHDNGLPTFRVFSNDWDANVQLEWLKIYKELRVERR